MRRWLRLWRVYWRPSVKYRRRYYSRRAFQFFVAAPLLGLVLPLVSPPQAEAASGLGEICHGYEWQADIRMYTPGDRATHYWLSIYQSEDHLRAAILSWDQNSASRKRWMFGKVVRVTGKNKTVARTSGYRATECETFPIKKGVYRFYGSASKKHGGAKIASASYRVKVG